MTTATPTFQAPYVRNDAGTLRGVVVVPPSAALAGVPPLQGEPNVIVDRAREQFAIFLGRLTSLGVAAIVADADEKAPLGTLCADGAVMFEDGAVLMRPSDLKRRPEVVALEAVLERAKVPIVGRIAAPGLLDGGDVLLAGDTLYVATSTPRQAETGIPLFSHGNALGREQLAQYARARNLTVVDVAVAAQVTRLRSVAALVDGQTLLVASGLVDVRAFAGLETIDVPRGEDYGAGVLTLGNRRVIANLRFRETIPRLRKAKIVVDSIDLWEFGKIGATPSSMALALKRD